MPNDLQTARQLNRGLILEDRPDLDPSVGSVVDSLLIDGAARLTVKNADNLRLVSQRLRLQNIAAGISDISDDEMDALAAAYATSRKPAQTAAGRVRAVVRDNRRYTVPAGSSFTVGALVFTTSAPVTVYGTLDPSAPAGASRLQEVYDQETGYLYQFVFPLLSTSTDPATALVSGDRLIWVDGPSGLGYTEATENFTPGCERETNQALAQRLLEGVTARVVSGRANVQALVQAAIPSADARVVGVNSPMMTRDRVNPFGVSAGGRVDIYIKSGGIARTGFAVNAVVTDDALRQVRVDLTREQAAGLYRASVVENNTAAPPAVTAGQLLTLSHVRTAWVDPQGFNPLMPHQADLAYSARSTMSFVLEDTREVSGTPVVDMSAGPGAVIEGAYRVEISYQPGLLAADTLLTGAEVRPAGLDVLVKAAVPLITTVSLVISRPVDYNGPSAATIEAGIAAEVNRLPLGTRQLDLFTLSEILSKIANGLVIVQASLTGVAWGQDGLNMPVNAVNQVLTIPQDITSKVSPDNAYFTTNSAQVTVTLV